MRRARILLIVICAIAAFFYFWHLGRADIVTDEASYMARGIGMLDFNFGIAQPTPLQWVHAVPWWMHMSFHDHPPLMFLLEHFAMGLFGVTAAAGRMVPALAGVLSVFLLYLIGVELYGEAAGLSAAALFAFTANHVWISRIALQESLVIALMLAASYAFLRAFERRQWLIPTGALSGIALLAKYTTGILVPVFLTLLAVRRRNYFFTKEFLFGVLLLCIAVSPIVVYNIGLYRTFGHFDFQISYILGEHVAAWQAEPGKTMIGSVADRAAAYLPTLFQTNSPVFLLLALCGVIVAAWEIYKKREGAASHRALFVFVVWVAALMFFIGPTHRFLTMLTPWLALFAGFFAVWAGGRFFSFSFAGGMILFLLVLSGEAAYAYNSVIAVTPLGAPPLTYASALRAESGNWGYAELEDFMRSMTTGKRPDGAIQFNYPYPVIAGALDAARARDAKAELAPVRWMFVYNGNISIAAQLWIFLRRMVYHGWLAVDAETYRQNGAEYFRKLGVEKIVFINSTSAIPDREVLAHPLTGDGNAFEAELRARDVAPVEIKNKQGVVAFRVYTFSP